MSCHRVIERSLKRGIQRQITGFTSNFFDKIMIYLNHTLTLNVTPLCFFFVWCMLIHFHWEYPSIFYWLFPNFPDIWYLIWLNQVFWHAVKPGLTYHFCWNTYHVRIVAVVAIFLVVVSQVCQFLAHWLFGWGF